MHNIKTIIWDWNGTLLDDVDICIEAINLLLKSRNHPALSKTSYREIFTFPVRDYYVKAGFDFSVESFDEIAIEFMDLYFKKLPHVSVFREAIMVLETFSRHNFYQVLISAMEHQSLVMSVKEKGIYNFFDSISGISDHFAAGKTENAKKLIGSLNPELSTTLLIGDTIHDYEVAKELGVQCLLVANGHQSANRLKKLGCIVVNNLAEIPNLLKINQSFKYTTNQNLIKNEKS
jgi:phosphoglycolate phosphatase